MYIVDNHNLEMSNAHPANRATGDPNQLRPAAPRSKCGSGEGGPFEFDPR
jgi:hypothetical protein